MKVTYSLPDALAHEVGEVSKATGYTKSGLVSTALNIYLLLYHADNQKAKQLLTLIPENQTSIFEHIKAHAQGTKGSRG